MFLQLFFTLTHQSSQNIYDTIVLGSGPAGSTAAIYTSRANLSTLVLHGTMPGGQLMRTTVVENFPTFRGTGPELVKSIQCQAIESGAQYINETAVFVDFHDEMKKIVTNLNNTYIAKSVIIATGAAPTTLGTPGEKRFIGKGLCSFAAVEGKNYENKSVAVVGGGDSALHDAVYLSTFCKNVKLFIKTNHITASNPLIVQLKNSPVEVFYNTEVTKMLGTSDLSAVEVQNKQTNETFVHNISALFVEIGQSPATSVFRGALDIDEYGYIVTNGTPATKIPGVFAAGDCANRMFRQAPAAAGFGCQAGLLAIRYVKELERSLTSEKHEL